jgi:membrane-associated phospholipid phosphatase
MPRHMFDRLAIQLVALATLTVLVGSRATATFDTSVLAWLLQWHQPLLDQVFQAITLLGDPIVSSLFAVGLLVALVGREGRRGQVVLIFFLGIALEYVLKQLVVEPGPPSELVRDAVLLPGLRELSPYTFPSGHVMRVTFLAAVVAAHFGRLRVGVAIVVALIAVGRIYLAAGWTSDVAGGLVAGLLLATIAEIIEVRLASHRRAGALAI